jgi:hypothetical protein
MLQGEINRFPTVACFRADVVIFLSFKNLTAFCGCLDCRLPPESFESSLRRRVKLTSALPSFSHGRQKTDHTVDALGGVRKLVAWIVCIS